MADKYIDNIELPIYNDYAARRVQTKIIGTEPSLDSALQATLSTLETRKNAFMTLLQSTRQAAADQSTGIVERHPKFMAGWNMLKRFLSHLGAHEEGTVDRKQFFRPTGTLDSIKRTPAHVGAALDWIAKLVADPGTAVEGAAIWKDRVEKARDELLIAFNVTVEAADERLDTTPSLEAAKRDWLQAYAALKLLTEAALRLAGKPVVLERYFLDLRVAAQTHVTQAPTEEEDAAADAQADSPEAGGAGAGNPGP